MNRLYTPTVVLGYEGCLNLNSFFFSKSNNISLKKCAKIIGWGKSNFEFFGLF
uniref:Uncharacterized protein n=1 Tax=Lepeophtheirus salmonis TaxID=72036 RepID=A0A0K2U8B8_LEPSM